MYTSAALAAAARASSAALPPPPPPPPPTLGGELAANVRPPPELTEYELDFDFDLGALDVGLLMAPPKVEEAFLAPDGGFDLRGAGVVEEPSTRPGGVLPASEGLPQMFPICRARFETRIKRRRCMRSD